MRLGRRGVVGALLGLGAAGCWGRSAADIGDETQVASLKGIHGFGLLIEPPAVGTEKSGVFTEHLIRKDVETALREHGIRVYSVKDAMTKPGSPLLYVRADIHPSTVADKRMHVLVQIAAQQYCTLERDAQRGAILPTWEFVQQYGAQNHEHVRKVCQVAVRYFVADWLRANAQPVPPDLPKETPRRPRPDAT